MPTRLSAGVVSALTGAALQPVDAAGRYGEPMTAAPDRLAWRHLTAPARAVAIGASRAVAAAGERDEDAFEAAVAQLQKLGPQQAGLVLGTVVRLLLEDLHPDGLDADDVRGVLEHCVAEARRWQPDVDPHVLLVLLASALGVHDPDADPAPPSEEALARHGALLVADLLAERRRPLEGYLTAAFLDIERAEHHD